MGDEDPRFKHRRVDWDVRGILAILAVLGAFSLAFTQLTLDLGSDIPAWAATLVGAVAGFYFGSRGGGSAGGNGYH